ncbi:hypothetical protein FTUN_4030 [Frigoriglobus tundricola]|uniref:Uncharacterized protein n=1 Tax=Frigoriglobus tundricola TaxID=2774151 RepID=A0A6M5YT26_9BACT|nr:hypothetical protein FTUN_4030 [Frigoriglobus tundricola]
MVPPHHVNPSLRYKLSRNTRAAPGRRAHAPLRRDTRAAVRRTGPPRDRSVEVRPESEPTGLRDQRPTVLRLNAEQPGKYRMLLSRRSGLRTPAPERLNAAYPHVEALCATGAHELTPGVRAVSGGSDVARFRLGGRSEGPLVSGKSQKDVLSQPGAPTRVRAVPVRAVRCPTRTRWGGNGPPAVRGTGPRRAAAGVGGPAHTGDHFPAHALLLLVLHRAALVPGLPLIDRPPRPKRWPPQSGRDRHGRFTVSEP